MVCGLSSLLQHTAAERWESTCRKAAHTHPEGKPVPLKQLSKDSNPPLVCKVMSGAFGGLVAEGDGPQQPLACTLSGVPHPCFFPSPSALPAYLPPAPSSDWQSLTLMGEYGWAAGLAGAAPWAPVWEMSGAGAEHAMQACWCLAHPVVSSGAAVEPSEVGPLSSPQPCCLHQREKPGKCSRAVLPACTLLLSSCLPAMESTSCLLSRASHTAPTRRLLPAPGF